MARQDVLTCVHEPFGDAFYFGPERLGERYENDPEAREASGFSESTFKTVLDRIEKEGKEVRIAFSCVSADGLATLYTAFLWSFFQRHPPHVPHGTSQRKYYFSPETHCEASEVSNTCTLACYILVALHSLSCSPNIRTYPLYCTLDQSLLAS